MTITLTGSYSISPNYDSNTDMTTIETRINVFQDAIEGWQLKIAKRLLEQFNDCGFASLMIVTAYFEMVGKILEPVQSGRMSKQLFLSGFLDVFPECKSYVGDPDFKAVVYSRLRCGLYHCGMAGGSVGVNIQGETPAMYDCSRKTLTINPALFIGRIIDHFARFIARLRSETELQTNFDKQFVCSATAQPMQTLEGSLIQAGVVTQPKIDDSNRHHYTCVNPYGAPNNRK